MENLSSVDDIWFDGICKKCGYPVIEMPDDYDKNYMNMCLSELPSS